MAPVTLTEAASFRLDGKRALVTGGGRGIGLAAASALAAAGPQVTLAAGIKREIAVAASARIGEYCSRPCVLEGFFAHAEQDNVQLRRHGGRNAPCGDAAK
jgi:NAD(P)-dependent dehydrogenase (short-subunit alcohol dehydrogenase family)